MENQPRIYRHKLTRRRFQLRRCRTRKDRVPDAVQYGLFTLRDPHGREFEITGTELRRAYEWLKEA